MLVRDLDLGTDPKINAIVRIIQRISPDILILNDFDYDAGTVALGLFAGLIAQGGKAYPFRFSARPNAGMATGLDMDGDGRFAGPDDAQAFGRFSGAGGMAVLSRLPIDDAAVRDFSNLLWKDVPGAQLPRRGDAPFLSAKARDIQRLSSKGHWDVPVTLPWGQVIHLLVSNPVPPVFDGPENRNGLRNRDEIRFWHLYLDRLAIPGTAEFGGGAFVLAGDLNADPMDGAGSHAAVTRLLTHPKIRDPLPASLGAVQAAQRQAGPNTGQKSDPAFDTVDWDETRTPGNMRVDYVLPSRDLKVTGAGVFWPAPDQDGYDLVGSNGDVGSHHRLVWLDVAR